jgi:hypothetical protein
MPSDAMLGDAVHVGAVAGNAAARVKAGSAR